MPLDKWLEDEDDVRRRKLKEDVFHQLPEEEKFDLKKQSIRELVSKEFRPLESNSVPKDIMQDILEFKEWLNSRTYLQGDTEKIETWIKNLNAKFIHLERESDENDELDDLNRKFREIPVDLIDEPTRIALNKKLRSMKRTSSDNYYLRKLKKNVELKLKEALYYRILKTILELRP
jgi:hypothetical protein